ncbi:unnamed protein product, partial [Phaeothamnion confervicola]
MGSGFFEAACEGSREIGFTVISMTISLVAVFIPILFMAGLIGRLFREFAVTMGISILVSGFVSLTLTPMLCSRFLRPPDEHPKGFYKISESMFSAWLGLYDWTLRIVLRFRFLTMVVSLILVLFTVHLFIIVPKGFMPADDTGELVGYTEADQSISYLDMVRHQQELAEIIGKDPNVLSYQSSVGTGGASATGNQGAISIYLKPRSERTLNADGVLEELRPKLQDVTGIKIYLQNPPSINIGGIVTKSLYQYTLQGPDRKSLYEAGNALAVEMAKIPGLRDVTTDIQDASPQVTVQVDRDKASLLGLTADLIDTTLDSAYGTRQASTIYSPTNEYYVIVEVMPQFYSDPNVLSMLYAKSSSTQKLIPLDTIAKFTRQSSPLLVNHLGQLPSVTVSFSLDPEMSLGTALPEVEKAAKKVLPETITGSMAGTSQAFEQAFQGLMGLLVLAILVIYIVLGILYESFIHPVTILAGLPSAGLGALLTLM